MKHHPHKRAGDGLRSLYGHVGTREEENKKVYFLGAEPG